MLQEYRIDDDGKQVLYDKEAVAIQRLKSWEDLALSKHPDGYYVCDSGGKDSLVIVDLAIRAGVKCDFHHNHTTADHPETMRYVRRRKAELEALGYKYTIHKPEKSMWQLIADKGLPTRFRRFCCQYLKEGGGSGRMIVTGVRWAESNKRASTRGIIETMPKQIKNKIIVNNDNAESRKVIESCTSYDKYSLNPIIDWSDDEVWEYIHGRQLSYNPLYDEGWKRVGCVGCPLGMPGNAWEFIKLPKYYNLYKSAAERYFQNHADTVQKYGWQTVDDMMDWWIRCKSTKQLNQVEMDFDLDEKVGIEIKGVDYESEQ